jgi:hypothetical protein
MRDCCALVDVGSMGFICLSFGGLFELRILNFELPSTFPVFSASFPHVSASLQHSKANVRLTSAMECVVSGEVGTKKSNSTFGKMAVAGRDCDSERS